MGFWDKIAGHTVTSNDYKYFSGDGALVVELLNVATGERDSDGQPWMSPEFKVLEVLEDSGGVNPKGSQANYFLLLETKPNGEPTRKGELAFDRAKRLASACLGGVSLEAISGSAIGAVFDIDPETGASYGAGTVLLAEVTTKVYPPKDGRKGGKHTRVSFTYLPDRN
jgi:hypothetical protein